MEKKIRREYIEKNSLSSSEKQNTHTRRLQLSIRVMTECWGKWSINQSNGLVKAICLKNSKQVQY